MECSKAADSRSKSGVDSTSMRMSPQRDVRSRRAATSAIDPHEMKHGVLVDDGRLLHVLDAVFVFEIGVDQGQLAAAMRLDQHAFEFDFGKTPIAVQPIERAPDMGDIGLAVADQPCAWCAAWRRTSLTKPLRSGRSDAGIAGGGAATGAGVRFGAGRLAVGRGSGRRTGGAASSTTLAK